MAPAVRVVTDSTTSVPQSLAERLGIIIVPCVVRFGSETFRDGIDISDEEFYHRLEAGPTLPSTSQPASGVFEEVYRRLVTLSHGVVSVHTASTLSGIMNSAHAGAVAVSDTQIELVDSLNTSLAAGWLAIAAAESALAGKPLRQIAQETRSMVPRTRLFAVLDTLEYLRKGGRVSWAAAFLGNLLQIKPILELRDGVLSLRERPRTFRRALTRVVEMVKEFGPLERLGVIHARAPDSAVELADLLGAVYPREKILITEASTSLASHAGPG
ncbi:MAG: DegV family protein, partial [Anaerolineae bacterium]|nr:DegV family protein [Anaerolineae bacterium]